VVFVEAVDEHVPAVPPHRFNSNGREASSNYMLGDVLHVNEVSLVIILVILFAGDELAGPVH